MKLAAGDWRLAAGYWQLAAGYWQIRVQIKIQVIIIYQQINSLRIPL
jgi:hypothetical protein